MEELLKKIIGSLHEKDFSHEKAVLKSLNGKSVSEEISLKNYSTLKKSYEYMNAFFIDGGSASLLSSSSFSLGFFRACIVKSEQDEFSVSFSEELYCAALQENDFFSLSTFPEHPGINKVRVKSKSLDESFSSFDSWKACSAARRLLEISLAIKAASDNKGSLIVLDGSLDGEEYEEMLLETLKRAALKNGNVVIGLSKSNSFSTNMNRPLTYALLSRKKNSWIYKLKVSPSDRFKACYVKFSDGSSYAFRADFFPEQESQAIKALESLAGISNDALFQGYPYGLVEADDFARISLEEKQSIIAGLASLQDWNLLEKAAFDIHELLDSSKF